MIWAALCVGLAVGVVVGALGAGGGILSVPILVYLLGQTPHHATAESLVIVIVTALVALPSRARRHQVKWADGLLFGLLSTVGAVAGTTLNRLAPRTALMGSFAVLLVGVGTYMLVDSRRHARAERTGEPRPRRGAGATHGVGHWVAVVVAATLTGLLTGFFGVGGGFAVVPILTIVLGFGIKEASGTSLLVMTIAGLASLAKRHVSGGMDVEWGVTLMFTAGSALGGIAGGPLSQRAKASTLTLVFALLLFAVAAFTVVETFLL